VRVDLNCDVGEGAPDDAALIAVATSVNVACGLHAGDPATMRRTVALAAARGVAIGAHPGYPDREGMGRRDLGLSPDEAGDTILYQIGALDAFVRAAGARLAHVKLHGALYNTAARQAPLADAAARAVASASALSAGGRPLLFVGLAGTEHERAAARAGLPFAAEVFADRTVGPDGQLTPRADPGAFVRDPEEAARRVLGMLRDGRVETTAGTSLPVRADTVCLHGDSPGAAAFARVLADRLRAAGVTLAALVVRT
jgi:UPF0271 protein